MTSAGALVTWAIPSLYGTSAVIASTAEHSGRPLCCGTAQAQVPTPARASSARACSQTR
ncbi:hypothetical protein OG381_22760 [Streptomyces sp. NBC_00490]|uniref:hypothetical protein n=1 Tax=Streptomyces sp. NBC_00490 TaxID=2903657 RepID=UPI002E18F1F3